MHNKNGFTRTSLKDSTSSPKKIAEDRSESDRGKAVSHKIKTMCTVRLKRLKIYTVAISQTAHMNEKNKLWLIFQNIHPNPPRVVQSQLHNCEAQHGNHFTDT